MIFCRFWAPGPVPKSWPRRAVEFLVKDAFFGLRGCRDIEIFVVLKFNFQAVIKSAASAASPKTESRGPSSRGAQDGGSACRRRGLGRARGVVPWIWSSGRLR